MGNSDGVTPGDWAALATKAFGEEIYVIAQANDSGPVGNGGCDIAYCHGPDRKANAAAIIKYRNAGPALVAVVEAVLEGLEAGNVASKIVDGPNPQTLHAMAVEALAATQHGNDVPTAGGNQITQEAAYTMKAALEMVREFAFIQKFPCDEKVFNAVNAALAKLK